MQLPPPRDINARPNVLAEELGARVGERRAVEICVALLNGKDPVQFGHALDYLGNRAAAAGGWPSYWPRVWGARGLLYLWSESDDTDDAVLNGLHDEAWRVAEMCLRVSARHELAAADSAIPLADHDLPRVRAAALRVLGVSGEQEHLRVVDGALDDDDEQVRRAAARAHDRLIARLDVLDC